MRLLQSILAAVLLLSACAPEAPDRVTERRPFAGNAPRGPALLRQAMTTMHNATRAEIRLPPLAWDDALAADAQGYADTLARTRRFEHSPQPRGTPNQGENLWTGTRGAYRYDEMAGHWIEEKRAFRNTPVPTSSSTGRFEDAGHYVQIVWRDTQRFGCAMAANARDEYLVCRYVPAGNMLGETAY